MITDLLDLDRYPIDRLDSPQDERLIDRCTADMAAHGMFNLEGLVKPGARGRVVAVFPITTTPASPSAAPNALAFTAELHSDELTRVASLRGDRIEAYSADGMAHEIAFSIRAAMPQAPVV